MGDNRQADRGGKIGGSFSHLFFMKRFLLSEKSFHVLLNR